METNSADKRMWTRVSGDGKHAAAGMSLGPVGKETKERLEKMNRDGFWIHNGSKPTHSQGCILLPETIRRQIPVGSILRVTL